MKQLKQILCITTLLTTIFAISECYASSDIMIGTRSDNYDLTFEGWTWDGNSSYSNPQTLDTVSLYSTGGLSAQNRGTGMSFSNNTLYIGQRYFDDMHIERFSYNDTTGFGSSEYLGLIALGTGASTKGLHGTTMQFVDNYLYVGTLESGHLTIQKWLWDGDTNFTLESEIANLALLNHSSNYDGAGMAFSENYAYFGIRDSNQLQIERWEWDGNAGFSNPVNVDTITLLEASTSDSQGTAMAFYSAQAIPEPMTIISMAIACLAGLIKKRF